MEVKAIRKEEKKFEPIDLVIKIETIRDFQLIKQFFGRISCERAVEIANSSIIDKNVHFNYRDEEVRNFTKIYSELVTLEIS